MSREKLTGAAKVPKSKTGFAVAPEIVRVSLAVLVESVIPLPPTNVRVSAGPSASNVNAPVAATFVKPFCLKAT